VFHNSTGIAQLSDKLGYHRYWFAEHQKSTALMSMFHKIMIAHVDSKTARIRVSSGEVMLPNNSALSITHNQDLHAGLEQRQRAVRAE